MAAESPSSGGKPSRDQLLSDPLGCCRGANCDHQLHQLVYCYYGFRPFLDNAQVQLSEASARASPASEQTRSRSGPARRRPNRGQSDPGGRGASRGPRGRASAGTERTTASRGSTPTPGQGTATGQRPSPARAATPITPARTGEQGRGRTGQKQGKTVTRSSAATTPSRSSTPNPAGATPPAPRTSHSAPLLPTPPSCTPAPSRSLTPRSQTRRPLVVSSPAASLTATPPPPLPRAPLEEDRHLVAIFDRLSLLATPPGALPAFVRVPPPSAGGVFCGSRSHGSLEVELGRCRFPRSAPRHRHHSGGAALTETEEAAGGATYHGPPPPPPCCPGAGGHQDSYDPRLDLPPAPEERTREQVRSERLLKNFDMFRDWNYVPFAVEPALERPVRRRASSLSSNSSSSSSSSTDGNSTDDDLEPTVTICSRAGGVFHYIPSQRLLKNGTAALRSDDVTGTEG